jgi:hypothetical protein
VVGGTGSRTKTNGPSLANRRWSGSTPRGVYFDNVAGAVFEVGPDGYEEGTPYPMLIWLHGFGADMHDLADLAAAVHPSGYLRALPNALAGGVRRPGGHRAGLVRARRLGGCVCGQGGVGGGDGDSGQ